MDGGGQYPSDGVGVLSVRLEQGMDMHEWIVGFHRVMDDCKQGSQIAVVADKDYNDCYPSCLMVMPYKEPCHLQQV